MINMIDIVYQRAFCEVLEILRYIPKLDYEKIPLEIIEVMEDNCCKGYNIKYNPLISLQEQNIAEEARIIIAIFFRDYWATEEQRKKILLKEKIDFEKLEKEKQNKYNFESIFQNKKNNNFKGIENRENITNTQIITIKENFLTKILNKLRRFFNKDK